MHGDWYSVFFFLFFTLCVLWSGGHAVEYNAMSVGQVPRAQKPTQLTSATVGPCTALRRPTAAHVNLMSFCALGGFHCLLAGAGVTGRGRVFYFCTSNIFVLELMLLIRTVLWWSQFYSWSILAWPLGASKFRMWVLVEKVCLFYFCPLAVSSAFCSNNSDKHHYDGKRNRQPKG